MQNASSFEFTALYGLVREFFSKLTTLGFLQVLPHANVVKKLKKNVFLCYF